MLGIRMDPQTDWVTLGGGGGGGWHNTAEERLTDIYPMSVIGSKVHFQSRSICGGVDSSRNSPGKTILCGPSLRSSEV